MVVSAFGFTQQPVIEWQKSLGGSSVERAHSIQQTSDDGYIIAGHSNSSDGDVTGNQGGYDSWVVKLDASGNMTWEKSLGGVEADHFRSIQQTTDGGYIVAGYSDSNGGDLTGNNGANDYWIVKLDAIGNIIWQNSLGGSGSEEAFSIQETTNGGYIVAGHTKSNNGDVTGNQGGWDYWVVRLDATGSITWQKSLGGSGYDYAHSIEQTTDGGYIVAGYSYSDDGDLTVNNGDADGWVVKLNATGDITWQKSLGGSASDEVRSVQQTAGGGYIVTGYSNSTDGDVTGNNGLFDYWVVKLDGSGNLTWEKSIGSSEFEYAYSIDQTIDGGYIVAGNSDSISGSYDYMLVKLDGSGNTDWQKFLGGSGFDAINSIQQTADEGFIIGGYSDSNDGDVTGNNGDDDFWIVKLSPETTSIDEYKELVVNVYPNPTTKEFTISSGQIVNSSFKLYNTAGKVELTGSINAKEQTIDISSLPEGAYTIVFEDTGLPAKTVIKE